MNPRTIYTYAAAVLLFAKIPAAYADDAQPLQPLTSAATHVTKAHANGQHVLTQYYVGYTVDRITVWRAHANNGKKPTAPEQIGISTVSSIITFWHKNKHLTMRDLKSILPRGTTIDRPDWYEGDQAVGNASSIQGRVTGDIVFLSASQRKKIDKGTGLTVAEQKYRPSDDAEMVQIELTSNGDGKPDRKAVGKRIVSLLTSALRAKPSNVGFVPSDSEDAGMVHGVTADWKLTGGIEVTYDDWRYGKSDVVVVSFDGA